jgi:hypothetical protein
MTSQTRPPLFILPNIIMWSVQMWSPVYAFFLKSSCHALILRSKHSPQQVVLNTSNLCSLPVMPLIYGWFVSLWRTTSFEYSRLFIWKEFSRPNVLMTCYRMHVHSKILLTIYLIGEYAWNHWWETRLPEYNYFVLEIRVLFPYMMCSKGIRQCV